MLNRLATCRFFSPRFWSKLGDACSTPVRSIVALAFSGRQTQKSGTSSPPGLVPHSWGFEAIGPAKVSPSFRSSRADIEPVLDPRVRRSTWCNRRLVLLRFRTSTADQSSISWQHPRLRRACRTSPGCKLGPRSHHTRAESEVIVSTVECCPRCSRASARERVGKDARGTTRVGQSEPTQTPPRRACPTSRNWLAVPKLGETCQTMPLVSAWNCVVRRAAGRPAAPAGLSDRR